MQGNIHEFQNANQAFKQLFNLILPALFWITARYEQANTGPTSRDTEAPYFWSHDVSKTGNTRHSFVQFPYEGWIIVYGATIYAKSLAKIM